MPSINAFIKNSLNENINDSSKHLYSFIKSKQINNIGVAPFKSNKLFYIYSQKKTRSLNSQFMSVFARDKDYIPQIHAKYAENSIINIEASSDGTVKLLQQLT